MIKLPSLGFDDVHDNDGELELCNLSLIHI